MDGNLMMARRHVDPTPEEQAYDEGRAEALAELAAAEQRGYERAKKEASEIVTSFAFYFLGSQSSPARAAMKIADAIEKMNAEDPTESREA